MSGIRQRVIRFFDLVDDRSNPIVVRELRQAVRSKMVSIALLLLLLGQMIVLLAGSGGGEVSRGRPAGREIFLVIWYILSFVVIVLIPLYAHARLASERSEDNVDLMFITRLGPVSIVWGKFCSTMLLVLLAYGATAPYMMFAYMLRGLDLLLVSILMVFGLLLSLAGVTGSLLLASFSAPRSLRLLIFFGTGGGLIGLYSLLVLGGDEMLRFGGVATSRTEFWYVGILFAALILVCAGLFSILTVALLSPPGSNRTLPVRIYILSAGILSWVLLYAFKGTVPRVMVARAWEEMMMAWGTVACIVLGLGFLAAICEGDTMSRRIQRQIPRNPLLRILAFLFYSGAAGGIVWCTVLIVIVLNLMVSASTGTGKNAGLLATLLGGLALYLYCFGMAGVLIRRLVNSIARRYYATNIVLLITIMLLAVCALLPPLLAEAFDYTRYRYTSSPVSWFLILNPTMLFDVSTRRINSHLPMVYSVFGFLAAVCTVLNLSWYSRQIRGFHPPKLSEDETSREVARNE